MDHKKHDKNKILRVLHCRVATALPAHFMISPQAYVVHCALSNFKYAYAPSTAATIPFERRGRVTNFFAGELLKIRFMAACDA